MYFFIFSHRTWSIERCRRNETCPYTLLILGGLLPFSEITSDAIVECMERFSSSSNARLSNLAKLFLQVKASVLNANTVGKLLQFSIINK